MDQFFDERLPVFYKPKSATFNVMIFILLIADSTLCLHANAEGEPPPLVFPENNTVYKIFTKGSSVIPLEQPPLVFPEDDTKYNITNGSPSELYPTPPVVFPDDNNKNKLIVKHVENMTAEPPPLVFPENSSEYKIYAKNVTFSNNSNDEAYDMLHENLNSTSSTVDQDKKALKVQIKNSTNSDPNSQVDLYQKDGADVKRDSLKNHGPVLNANVGKWVITVLCMVLLAILASFAGFVVYKRHTTYSCNRRHILINEQDNPNDFKYSEF